jgi:hypothetical protein
MLRAQGQHGAPSASVHAMRVVSVNVGRPRTVCWKGLSVHGGAAKAVYAYPLEHYAFWREDLGRELVVRRLRREPHGRGAAA